LFGPLKEIEEEECERQKEKGNKTNKSLTRRNPIQINSQT
jgi:hypothetical protein